MDNGQQPNYYDEYEIDLREYIMLLWDNKFFIAGLVILAIIAAFLFSSLILSPQYESESSLYANDFELVNGDQLTRVDYLTFFKRTSILKKLINDFSLNENNPGYSTQNLSNKISISTDNNIIHLSLTDSDPTEASELLSEWISLFQEELNSYISSVNNNFLKNLEMVMSSRKENLITLQNEMKNFRESSNYQLLTQRLETNRNILTGNSEENIGIENQIENLRTNIEADSSTLKRVEEQIKTINQFINEESYINPEELRVLRGAIPENENLEDLTVIREMINPLYDSLKEKENELVQNLAQNKARLKSLETRKVDLEETVNSLEQEVAGLENEYENLKMELDSARENYSNAKFRFDEAQADLNSKDYSVDIINNATLPSSPVSPNIKLNVAIAAVLALMLAVFIIFFREFMKEE